MARHEVVVGGCGGEIEHWIEYILRLNRIYFVLEIHCNDDLIINHLLLSFSLIYNLQSLLCQWASPGSISSAPVLGQSGPYWDNIRQLVIGLASLIANYNESSE